MDQIEFSSPLSLVASTEHPLEPFESGGRFDDGAGNDPALAHSPAQRETGSGERGMTLVEVIAVVVLLALIWVVVGRSVFGQSDAAKAQLNLVKMNNLKQYLGQYRLQYNTYPPKLEDLVHGNAETKKPGTVFTPLATAEDLEDIWKTPYIYIPENNNRSYVLKSLGSDSLEGGDGSKSDVEVRP